MVAGIRTRELRKVYNSAPPVAAGTGGFSFGAPKAKGKQPRPEIVALDGISLDILPGEIFCLLGPNGAGKSTTVGVLTTRVRPTGGQAFIGEYDVWQNQVAVKRLIGVVAQRPNLDFSLTAREILTFPRGSSLRLRFGLHSPDFLIRPPAFAAVREARGNDSNGADVYADRGGSLVAEVAALASGAGVALCDVHISEPSLENLFLHHTGRSLRE